MLVLTIREGSEIEIETPNGLIRLKFQRKNGKNKVGIEMGANRWPVIRTNDGMTASEVRADREARISAGRIKRREMENQIDELRFGLTQAGLDYLANRMEEVK